MAKHRRRSAHTKRRKHRGGWEWDDLNPFKNYSDGPLVEQAIPEVKPLGDAAQQVADDTLHPIANGNASDLLGTAPLDYGETSTGGRRRRRRGGSRKTRRRHRSRKH